LREETRNLRLRRVDWRFLLPDPSPREVVCLEASLLAPLKAVSRRVREEAHLAGTADLAVAVDPDPATLRAARAALEPRGALYTEWRSRLSGGWRSIPGRLEEAGFAKVECYWARPDPARSPARVWLPLEEQGPLEYYRAVRVPTRNPLRKVGRAVRRLQWLLRPRRPVCAVARKPAPIGGAPAVAGAAAGEELTETIRARWSDWGLGPTPRRLSRILLAEGARSSGKVVALFFADGDRQPRAAVKMPRTPESVPGLLREAETLCALQGRPGGVPGAPRVLLCRAETGVVVETALPGVPLSGFLRRESFRDLAFKGAVWLGDLTGPTRSSPRIDSTDLADRALADFEASFGGAVDAAMLRETAQILARLDPLPRVCEQRDFSPWNVFLDAEGKLVVLDWESAELQGLPALDLVYFLTYLAFYLDRALRIGRYRESFRRSLDPVTQTGGVAKELLAWYAERTGLPRAAVRPLRLLAWLLHSRSEHRRIVEDAGPAPDSARLRRSIFVNLWELELRYGGLF
jgi:hypothetical protein